MNKKAPKVDIPTVAPKNAAKGKKPEPILMKGHEKTVDLMVEKKYAAEEATKIITQARGDLDPLVTNFRNAHEVKAGFTKTIHVAGTNVNAVYTFKDSYAKIDVSVEGDLKRLLGPKYDELFTREKDISVKKGSMEKLLALAKQHNFLDLLEEDEYLAPVDEFREKRFEIRSELSAEQNKALDDVVGQVSSKPTVNFK